MIETERRLKRFERDTGRLLGRRQTVYEPLEGGGTLIIQMPPVVDIPEPPPLRKKKLKRKLKRK